MRFAAENGFVDIGTISDAGDVTHTRVRSNGDLEFERHLGAGDLLWVSAGEVIARSTSRDELITSRAAAPGLLRQTLVNGDLRKNYHVVARLAADDLIFGAPPADGGMILGDDPEPVYLARFAGAVEIWRRDGQSGRVNELLILPGGMRQIRQILTTSDAESLHVFDASSGATVWRIENLPWSVEYASEFSEWPSGGTGLSVSDAATGGLALAYPQGGQIFIESYDFLGHRLSTRAARCGVSCDLKLLEYRLDGVEYLATRSNTTDGSELVWGRLDAPFTPRRVPLASQRGLAGVFVSAADVNRGYMIDYISSNNTLFVARFAGETAGATDRRYLDWETFQGSGVTVDGDIVLTRHRSRHGEFGRQTAVVTEPNGAAILSFDGCDHAVLTLRPAAWNPEVPEEESFYLQRLGRRQHVCEFANAPADPAQITRTARGLIDTRQSGAWLIEGANSQGILAAVEPATDNVDGVFFAPWFTYWPSDGNNPLTDNRHWLTLQAPIPTHASDAVTLGIYRSTAGSHFGVDITNTQRIGEAVWTFTSCERASVSYVFEAGDEAWPFQSKQGSFIATRPGACSGGP